jgi:hypothetical protein
LWDRAFQPARAEVHIDVLSDGRIARLLGNHYRRERGDFLNIGRKGSESR